MRRILKLSLTCLAAGAVTACDPDKIVPTEAIPTAGVRFINAVPDTAAMDFRWVDRVESNGHWGLAYRANIVTTGGVPASTLIQFKGARAGSRNFKIFMNGGCTTNACDQSYASTVVKDTTVVLVAGRNYTAILWGYSNPTRTGAGASLPAGAPAMRLDFIDEGEQMGSGTQVDLRVFNATAAAIDVEAYNATGTETGTPTWNDVPALSVSSPVSVAPAQYLFDVRTGAGAALIATDARALIGAAAVEIAPGPFDAQPGTTVAGSAVSAIVWPRSVTGSPAPSVTAASISFVWDRRPPRPSGV